MASRSKGVVGARSWRRFDGERQRLDDALGQDVDLRRRRSAGRASSSSASHAITEMRGDRQTDERGAGPVARATRRTASPSGISSGPRTAIVESARRASPRRCRLEDPCDIVDGDRPDGSVSQADQAEDRERVEGVAQVVEHVVAAPVDDAGLEDRVGQARGRTSSSAAHFERW